MMFDFSSMIREFGVPLEIKQQTGKDAGSYSDAGEGVPNTGSTTVKVNEPLVPPKPSMSFTYTDGGSVNTFDADWYSEQPGIAVGTIVMDLRTGQNYQVADATDYVGYSTVTIYHLKAVTSYATTV